ncbi:hypothetical protein G7Z17_g7220 [Cylindrodendrum hubeiense]|uniref:DUF3533 domain-containing protein n=1 Tax=Cylindrodendrum hubeiense TaxID=595255 RepID=A0A9P5LA43_9HYPO|nr:hypothetical protein G7Z17_g7220 [Cylindrodendrum hubeiense]
MAQQLSRDQSREPTLHDEPEIPEARHGINSPQWRDRRAIASKALVGVMLGILIIFLADLSYLFGATFKVNDRVSTLNILIVDYNGGPVGEAIANAYKGLQSKQFPSLELQSTDDYPNVSDVKHGVCKADYWGAIYIHKGASARLAAAYDGGAAAEDFNPSDSITYIYNAARYPTVASGYLTSNLQTLLGASRAGYYQTKSGQAALRSINTINAAAVQAYLNPIQGTTEIIQPTNQGSRNLYNTINIIMAILGQFFYVLAINGLFDKFGIHKGMRVRNVWLMRFTAGKIFSMLFAIVVTGYIWAFREDWDITSSQWALNWLTFWLFIVCGGKVQRWSET